GCAGCRCCLLSLILLLRGLTLLRGYGFAFTETTATEALGIGLVGNTKGQNQYGKQCPEGFHKVLSVVRKMTVMVGKQAAKVICGLGRKRKVATDTSLSLKSLYFCVGLIQVNACFAGLPRLAEDTPSNKREKDVWKSLNGHRI